MKTNIFLSLFFPKYFTPSPTSYIHPKLYFPFSPASYIPLKSYFTPSQKSCSASSQISHFPHAKHLTSSKPIQTLFWIHSRQTLFFYPKVIIEAKVLFIRQFRQGEFWAIRKTHFPPTCFPTFCALRARNNFFLQQSQLTNK